MDRVINDIGLLGDIESNASRANRFLFSRELLDNFLFRGEHNYFGRTLKLRTEFPLEVILAKSSIEPHPSKGTLYQVKIQVGRDGWTNGWTKLLTELQFRHQKNNVVAHAVGAVLVTILVVKVIEMIWV